MSNAVLAGLAWWPAANRHAQHMPQCPDIRDMGPASVNPGFVKPAAINLLNSCDAYLQRGQQASGIEPRALWPHASDQRRRHSLMEQKYRIDLVKKVII